MKRQSLQTVAIVLVCVLALALAAGSLQTAVSGGGVGIGEDDDGIPETGEAPEQGTVYETGERPDSDLRLGLDSCVEPLMDSETHFAFVLLLTAVSGVLFYANRGQWAMVAFVFGFMGWFIATGFLISGCEMIVEPTQFEPPEFYGNATNETDGGAGSVGPGGLDPRTVVPTALVVLLAALMALVGAVAVVRGDDDEIEVVEESDEEPEPDREAVRAAAGRAAAELDADADLENAVYRAWVEMTAPLGVRDPETTTPGQFERAAVDAGLDPEDVRTVTALFEAVRYGDEPVTEERERQAVEALERIDRRRTERGVGGG